MKAKKEIIDTSSDLITSGTVTGVMSLIISLPPDIQTVVSLALPALACGSNLISNLHNERIFKKDKAKIEAFVNDLKKAMEKHRVKDLQHFTSLNFPIEIYSVVEDIIKEAVNAKGSWLRKLAAHFIVIIGSADDPNRIAGKQLCLEIIKELNENDLKLLLLYELSRQEYHDDREINSKKINDEKEAVMQELLEDPNVFAHTILVCSNKLSRLGLVMRGVALHPYDDERSNKQPMIIDFLSQNRGEVTAYYSSFRKYIHGFI